MLGRMHLVSNHFYLPIQQKNAHPGEDERLVRGATSVRPFRLLTENPRLCCNGEKASLTRLGYGSNAAYTLCPDNGGNSGAS